MKKMDLSVMKIDDLLKGSDLIEVDWRMWLKRKKIGGKIVEKNIEKG